MSVSPIDPDPINPSLFDVDIGWKNADGEFSAAESFSNVSMDSTDAQYIEGVITDVSELVTVDLVDVPAGFTSDNYLGTSTSGDLSSVLIDFSALSGSDLDLEVSIDGNTAFTIPLPSQLFASLSDLASEIQRLVRTGGSTDRRTNFTCEVLDDKFLVLTSGTRKATSSVVIASDTGIAPTLRLGISPTDHGGSELTGQTSADATTSSEDALEGGGDGVAPVLADYQAVFTAFLKYRDINIICLPGQAWASNGSGNPVIDAAIAHAEKMKSRMVIVDPPSSTELETQKDVTDLTLPNKTYSVLYYPWVKVANPFYNAETNPGANRTVLVPPCGYAAGTWAKTDGRRGVWKAPAGLETGLLGVAGLEYVIEDGEQDQLNPLGVNCLRKVAGSGPVVWGSRTLATKADPEWRYVPVRRTAIMIEQSIYNGIQWAVFEPNKHTLWSSLRANIGSFMNGLFRAGAFQGEKSSDAYFVRCGLGDTMTQGDIDRGQVIVIVGFAPLKPAEFVIVRIQQKVGQE